MSPEQLEGREAEARTDLFAFGAVLYETLAGRRAFEGETESRVIAAVLDSDPPPITASQPLTPPLLEHVVKRCLAKDRDERWQTIHDVCLWALHPPTRFKIGSTHSQDGRKKCSLSRAKP
jgi:serine/threonine-protein kinase